MKRGYIILLVLLLLVGIGIALGFSMLHNGLSARATPTVLEAFFARHAHRLSIPSNARNMHNPMPASEENLNDAREHFADHCSTCHGNDGSGDTMYGKGLYPKPPDLSKSRTQDLTDGELFWIIENGVRFTGMPAFGGGHGSEDDSWKLVLFIRHLPRLTDQERIDMERMNPKGPDDRDEEKDEQDFLGGQPAQQKAPAKHHSM